MSLPEKKDTLSIIDLFNKAKQMEFNNTRYQKQFISIDVTLFAIDKDALHVLLVNRNQEPFKGCWSLPGGGLYKDETAEEAVKRELKEKLNVDGVMPSLAGVFSDPMRDSRMRNISLSYYVLADKNKIVVLKNESKLKDVRWFNIAQIPPLAFDHRQILDTSLRLLQDKIYDMAFMKKLLPTSFTLGQLQRIYESILGTPLDKRNFRRKLNALNCLKDTGQKNDNDPRKKSAVFVLAD